MPGAGRAPSLCPEIYSPGRAQRLGVATGCLHPLRGAGAGGIFCWKISLRHHRDPSPLPSPLSRAGPLPPRRCCSPGGGGSYRPMAGEGGGQCFASVLAKQTRRCRAERWGARGGDAGYGGEMLVAGICWVRGVVCWVRGGICWVRGYAGCGGGMLGAG